ncbi:hypothetical protein E2320_002776, partial [Naja naja]
GEGEIGELSKEEEEEIHRVKPDRRSGPQGTSQRPLWCAGCKGNHPGQFANSGIQSAIDAREGGILLKHAEQI